MGFKASKADANLWHKAMETHYQYEGTYDNQLIASKNPHKIITKLKQQYVLKGVGIPKYYLGGDVIQAGEEWKCEPIDWILAAKTYTKNVVAKFEELMASGRSKFQFAE